MLAIIGIGLKIAAYLIPWIMELFSSANKVRRKNEKFDEALLEVNDGDITRFMSQRIDSVRAKGGSNTG
jgi:hypothetical protein